MIRGDSTLDRIFRGKLSEALVFKARFEYSEDLGICSSIEVQRQQIPEVIRNLSQVQQSDGRGWTLKGRDQQTLAFRSKPAPGYFGTVYKLRMALIFVEGCMKKEEEEKM